MAAIYKSGSKWVVKTSTSTYNLDSGDCILTETTDGNYFQLKLNGETILNSSYTIVTDESGSPYSKPELVALLDELLVKNATGLNGFPARLSASVTRPADTADYAAGDSIGAVAAKVKQVSTITLIGTDGNADVAGTGGLTKRATFNTSLTQTATDFVTDHAAAYLALDISVVVTSDGEDIIFTAAEYDTIFIAPVIANVDESLSGTVVSTPNVSLAPITISSAATANGGGGFIMEAKIETDAVEFAGKTVRVWLFNETPTSMVGDNVAYVSLIADSDARMSNPYFDVVFDALLSGSDTVIGKVQPNMEFICGSESKDIVLLLQTLSAVTTPTSGGVFKIDLNAIKI